jgi:hypothetical protein
MRPILIVVPAPSLHLFPSVGKRQEPMRVQTFSAEPPIEGFNERIVRWLARPREVQRYPVSISP